MIILSDVSLTSMFSTSPYQISASSHGKTTQQNELKKPALVHERYMKYISIVYLAKKKMNKPRKKDMIISFFPSLK